MDELPKILIIGPSRAGKDTVGEMLSEITGWKYGGTTSMYLVEMYCEEYGLDYDETYAKRHEIREELFEYGNRKREDNPGLFINEALRHGNIIAGIRAWEEYEWAVKSGTIQYVLWVERDVPEDPTLKIDRERARNLKADYPVTPIHEGFMDANNSHDLQSLKRDLADTAKFYGWTTNRQINVSQDPQQETTCTIPAEGPRYHQHGNSIAERMVNILNVRHA